MERYSTNLSKQLFQKQSFALMAKMLVVLIAVLVLVRDVGGIEISKYIFLVIASVACFLSDKYGIYCIIAFIAPFAVGFPYTYFSAIALLIILFKVKFRLRVNAVGLICIIAILCLELLSAFRGMFSLIDFLRFSGVFLLAFLMMLDVDKCYRNEKLLNYFLFGLSITLCSLMGQMLNSYSLSEIMSLGIRFGNTRQFLNIPVEGMLVSYNPNGLGLVCLQGAILCLLKWKKHMKWYYIVAFVSIILLGIMTQSRTFLIVSIITIILYALFSSQNLKKTLQSLFFLTIGGVSIYLIAIRFVQEYAVSFSRRFQAEDLSNNRIQIMQYYFGEIVQHFDRLLIGVGLQNYQEKYGVLFSAHNATQEVIIAWGVMGLIAVVLLFYNIFHNAYSHNPNAMLVQYIPIIATLIYIQSGQGFSDTAGILQMMVMYSVILIPMKKPSILRISSVGKDA